MFTMLMLLVFREFSAQVNFYAGGSNVLGVF